MPELPEVECVRRSLLPVLLNRRIAHVQLLRPDFLAFPDDDEGETDLSDALLENLVVSDIRRHGKQLAVIAGPPKSNHPRVVIIHLGMSGQVLFTPPDAPFPQLTHVHAIWTLSQPVAKSRGEPPAGAVLFRDPRRFGGLWALNSLDELSERWTELGPDALTIDPGTLAAGLNGSRRAIKAALLDQAVIAGVGNIYADEVLFQARIHPARPCLSLSTAETRLLAAAIPDVLTRSIESGGSTLRDYRNAAGESGTFQTKRAVYGRAGEPCVRCGTTLVSDTLAQRTTTWCPWCQQS